MRNTTSPLRYPGGKACMYDLVSEVLRINSFERSHYAEPYAGGCGLALPLLYGGHVADIHINDIDVAVWAFWHCVLHDTDAFIERIEKTPVTIKEWRKQRSIFRKKNQTNWLALGFSAFFLNRTNRSGIIKDAGVIGGLNQDGEYKLDCRFNRTELSHRITRIAKYKDRIHLTNLDALHFLNRFEKRSPANSLMFIDPPYFKTGSSLYTNFYQRDDHAAVAERVMDSNRNWIVTYDDAPEIRTLYRDRRQYQFDIHYSLHEKRTERELLIASKKIRMPAAVRDRQVNRPQYRAA